MDYAKLYNALISFRKSNPLKKSKELYTEVHHIVPKCLGGSDDHENLIRLTAREHFIAHRLLSKCYRDNPNLALAVLLMIGTRQDKNRRRLKVSSKECEGLRKLVAESQSEIMKERWKDQGYRGVMSKILSISAKERWKDQEYRDGVTGENHPMYGRTGEKNPMYGAKHTDEAKQRMSESKTGVGNFMFGKNHSEESKRQTSKTLTSKFLPDEYAIDDPKHFFWERADELMYAMSKAGVKKVSSDIIRGVYKVHGETARNASRTIAKRIFEHNWNPLNDDRWIEYTAERTNKLYRPHIN